MRRGDCPVCHRSLALRHDGTLWIHGGRLGMTERCPGSRTLPRIQPAIPEAT